MKKFICFISFIVFLTCSYAQENYYSNSSSDKTKNNQKKSTSYDDYNNLEGKRVVFGICFGPNFSWMNWKNHKAAPAGYERSSKGVKLGLRYGLNLDIDLTKSKNFYVSTGILVEHIGGSLNFNDNLYLIHDTLANINIDRKYKSIYLTIPTAITLKTPSFSNFIVCGNVGLYHSFNLYSRYQNSFQIDPDAKSVDKESINHVTTDWEKDNETAIFKESVFAGLGLEYVIKNRLKAKLYINYVQSLNNYFNKNSRNGMNPEIKEKASIGSVEILFGLSF